MFGKSVAYSKKVYYGISCWSIPTNIVRKETQMSTLNTFSFLSHSPASSKDKKSTYYSTSLSGYSTQWTKHTAPKTAQELASELELIGTDAFLASQELKRTFKPVDAVSEALNDAYKAHDYNAPDNY